MWLFVCLHFLPPLYTGTGRSNHLRSNTALPVISSPNAGQTRAFHCSKQLTVWNKEVFEIVLMAMICASRSRGDETSKNDFSCKTPGILHGFPDVLQFWRASKKCSTHHTGQKWQRACRTVCESAGLVSFLTWCGCFALISSFLSLLAKKKWRIAIFSIRISAIAPRTIKKLVNIMFFSFLYKRHDAVFFQHRAETSWVFRSCFGVIIKQASFKTSLYPVRPTVLCIMRYSTIVPPLEENIFGEIFP